MANAAHTIISPSVSPRLSSLLAEPLGYDAPGRSEAGLHQSWEAAKLAYRIAEAKHGRAEADRVVAFLAKADTLDSAASLAWESFKRFEGAANRLIETAIPIGSRKEMETALYWKRLALKRFSARDKPDWRDVIAEDAARIPPPRPRRAA